MPTTYDRRSFLRRAGLAGAGAALLTGVARPPARADDDLAPFVHGVASGDPTPDGVVLWTRVTPSADAAVQVAWRVARDVGMTDLARSGTTTASADDDFTVKVDVDGLDPGTWYFYVFEALGRSSLVGRTKTAPEGAVDHLRFGVVSCANYTGGFFNAYATLAKRDDLDAVVHLGDYVYEYGNGDDRYGPGTGELAAPRDHEPPYEMLSLADYRLRHGSYKLDPDLRRLHQLLPFVTVWDDHESTDNSRRDSAHNHEPEDDPDTSEHDPEGEWQVRKAAAMRAYSEWMPIRTDDPARIYRTLRYGDVLDIVMLDTRLEGRDDEVGTTGATIVSGEEIDDPERQLISAEQRAFLFDALSTSTARWRVIGQQVMLGQWNGGGLPSYPETQDVPRFVLRDGGNALNPDQWDGYTAERDRLFAHLRSEGIGNVVVLTGDLHTSWALDLVEDPYDPRTYDPLSGVGALGVELVTPSITSASFETFGPGFVAAAEAGTKADNPHVKFVDFDDHGYFVLDVTPAKVQADWYFVDTVLEPSDGEALAASWQVLDGDDHLTPASEPAAAGQPAPATPGAEPSGAAPGDGAPTTAPPTGPAPAPGGSLPATGWDMPTPAAAAALGAAALAAKIVARRARLAADDRPPDT